nr:MAG TPA: hypothetical protein [Caudoviricetes sp.]
MFVIGAGRLCQPFLLFDDYHYCVGNEEQKSDVVIGIYVLKIDSRYSFCNFVARIIHYLCSN